MLFSEDKKQGFEPYKDDEGEHAWEVQVPQSQRIAHITLFFRCKHALNASEKSRCGLRGLAVTLHDLEEAKEAAQALKRDSIVGDVNSPHLKIVECTLSHDDGAPVGLTNMKPYYDEHGVMAAWAHPVDTYTASRTSSRCYSCCYTQNTLEQLASQSSPSVQGSHNKHIIGIKGKTDSEGDFTALEVMVQDDPAAHAPEPRKRRRWGKEVDERYSWDTGRWLNRGLCFRWNRELRRTEMYVGG